MDRDFIEHIKIGFTDSLAIIGAGPAIAEILGLSSIKSIILIFILRIIYLNFNTIIKYILKMLAILIIYFVLKKQI